MQIERAQESDIKEINRLLFQVLEVHHKGRPDLFKGNSKKYTDEQLKAIINDDNTPIFVAFENDRQKFSVMHSVFLNLTKKATSSLP